MPDTDQAATDGGRHADRVDRKEELLKRIIQAIDWYVLTTGESKDRALTFVIDDLVKKKTM
jgi:hypothetical protein